MNKLITKVLNHGSVRLLNLAGPFPRQREDYPHNHFSADDTDPAKVARISFDNFEGSRTEEQDLKLYEYLIAHEHSGPIEMIETWWHMSLPISVARQFVRHRTSTINEVSARYSKLPGEWYIPKPEDVGFKAKSNKQGRELLKYSELTMSEQCVIDDYLFDLDNWCSQGYKMYEAYLEKGIAPELARGFLSVHHYTEWVFKIDLHNLMHFLSLRLDHHTQLEARVYAQAMYDFLEQYLPKSMELFDTYRRKDTKEELQVLIDALDAYTTLLGEQTPDAVAKFQRRFKKQIS